MRIILCDDEKTTCEILEKYLREYFTQYKINHIEIESYDSGEALLADMREVDIAFLDVELTGVSGIEVARKLKRKYPEILIFMVTAYQEYLDDAMGIQVFRYLTKPIDKQRLFRNLKAALFEYNMKNKKIGIETKQGVTTVFASKIICVEAKNGKVYVYTADAVFESVHNMQYWKNELTLGCFFQTHRSYIVNMEYIQSFDKTLLQLTDERVSPYITRRKYVDFKNAYLMYLESVR